MAISRIGYLIVCIFGMIIVACTSESSTAPGITPIPPGPEPGWLTVLYPKPSQTTSLDIYKSTNRQTPSGIPLPDVPDSSICVEILADWLFNVGDHWDSEDIVSRTTVVVDGIERTIAPGLFDGIVLHTIGDSEGNQLASVGGPYSFCVIALIEAGTHQVDISFQKSSGEIKAFSWTFTVVDGPIPTPTALAN